MNTALGTDGVSAPERALALEWVFGVNTDGKAVVHNLSTGLQKAIFYHCGQTGILYDVDTHRQHLLQGHRYSIVTSAVSADRRFVVTIDDGEDGAMIVWDIQSTHPVWDVELPKDGIEALDMSGDGKYIVSLSQREPDASRQTISLWDWTVPGCLGPRLIADIAANDYQTCVRFHPDDPFLVVTNGAERVVFWSSQELSWKYYSPPVSEKDLRQELGAFTQSSYIPSTDLAASGTVDGDVCLWAPVQSDKPSKPTDKVALKVVRAHKRAITFLTTVGSYLVTGGADGFVRFFDSQLRIAAWFEDLSGGPVVSVSFGTDSPMNASTEAANEGLRAPDFVVSTTHALVIDVPTASFAATSTEMQRGRLLVQGQDQPVACVAAHPSLPRLAISGPSGQLHLFEYTSKKVLLLAVFKNLHTTSMAFDPAGRFLVLGAASGTVKILDAKSLQEKQSLDHVPHAAARIAFAVDSSHFAVADADNCLGVYRYMHRNGDTRKPLEWVYVGRSRAHRAPIAGLQFGPPAPDSDLPRLFSVGEDRRLVEYDLLESTIESGLRLLSVHKATHGATPTAFAWPSRPLGDIATGDPHGVLAVCSDDHKIRLLSSETNRRCLQTVSGPTYGGPLTHLLVSAPTGRTPCAVYTTAEKVVGLLLLPLDGNPHRTMGVLAHPHGIPDAALSHDGRYLFTAGGEDRSVGQWRIDAAALRGDGSSVLENYIDAVDGGKDGEVMKELMDYFYYAQVRSQGEETTAKRKIEGSVPFAQVPNLMRAMGCYLSERDIEDLTHEVTLRNPTAATAGELPIDFETFMRLYINHRPFVGINKHDIERAFAALGADPNTGELPKSVLLDLLTERGEALTYEELHTCLQSLLGEGSGPEALSETLTAKSFAEGLLGFEDYAPADLSIPAA